MFNKELLYMKRLLQLVLVFFFLGQTAVDAAPDDPRKFLKSHLDAIIAILQNKDLEQEKKKSLVLERVTPRCDFALMAKLTLGRKHWPGLSEENQKKFMNLFVERLKKTYLGNLGLYTDEKIVYGDSIQQGSKVQIPIYIISKDSKISTIFKLYYSETGWKIYDAEVQGVSIILSYRSQFDQVLKNGTFEDLLMKLEQQAEEANEQMDVEDNPIMKQ